MEPLTLALGGGGVRGIAHIGVIRRLQEAGYPIAAISGTSVGAIVGAIYAAGYSIDDIEDALEDIDFRSLFRREHGDGPSLLGLGGLRHLLDRFIGRKTFDDLRIPFACTAVDLNTDQEIIINSGRLMEAVQASAAVPGVFPPVRIHHLQLVDGGIVDPVPVSVARWLAPRLPVVAVCLHPPPEDWAELAEVSVLPPNPLPPPLREQFGRLRIAQAFRIFSHSMDVTSRMLAEMRLKVDQPEVLIRPHVGTFGWLDPVSPPELATAGYLAAEQALEDIQAALGWRRRMARQFRTPPPPGQLFSAGEEDEHPDERGRGF